MTKLETVAGGVPMSGGYIVYHSRTGGEKRQRFNPENINHVWAKAFYDEYGPHKIAMGPRGAGYEYRVDAEVSR